MELAHVVYRISTDEKYAAQFHSNPEESVEKLGLKLSNNELAALLSVLSRSPEEDILTRAERGFWAAGWMA